MKKNTKRTINTLLYINLAQLSQLSAQNINSDSNPISNTTFADSWLFWTLMLFVVCGISYIILFFILKRVKSKHKQEIDELATAHSEQVNQIENTFYTKITQEIIPLSTQTIQPIKYLISEEEEYDHQNNKQVEELILKNSEKTYALLCELIEPYKPKDLTTEPSSQEINMSVLEKKEEDPTIAPIATKDQKEKVNNSDQLLVENTIKHIKTNIENPGLTVETMSRELGISRTHLHRKLKKLTGKSPIDLIISIRMEQAALLLKRGDLSISEVGYKVGYNTPSYFSTSFNTFYKMTPTVYIEKEAAKD